MKFVLNYFWQYSNKLIYEKIALKSLYFGFIILPW